MHYLVLDTGYCSFVPPVNGLRKVTAIALGVKHLAACVVFVVDGPHVGQVHILELYVTLKRK